MIKKCVNCGQEKEHHAKGLCFNCYTKIAWKPKLTTCKRCGREMYCHAKGLCPGCYSSVFNLSRNKAWNTMKNYGLDMEVYKDIIKSCVLCGFDKVVDLHHLDQNKKNNSGGNLIGLCPNHHKMVHDFRYRAEILNQIKEKGFNVPDDRKLNFSLTNTSSNLGGLD